MAKKRKSSTEPQVEENPKPQLGKHGEEIGDPTPVAIPMRFLRTENIIDEVRRTVRAELSNQAADQGFESFEEADDFDVGDDFEPASDYELDAEQENFTHVKPADHDGSSETTEGDAGEGTDEEPERVQRNGKKSEGSSAGDSRNKRKIGGGDDDAGKKD